MAETDYSLAVRVQAHLRAAGLPVPDVPDIIPVLASARETVARRIADDDERADELYPDEPFTVTLTDGEASLSDLIGPPNRVLLSKFSEADVRDPSGAKLYYVARSRYELKMPAAYGYYTYDGPLLLARFKGEEVGQSDGDVKVYASIVAAADNLPASVVPDVVVACAALLAPPPPKKGRQ